MERNEGVICRQMFTKVNPWTFRRWAELSGREAQAGGKDHQKRQRDKPYMQVLRLDKWARAVPTPVSRHCKYFLCCPSLRVSERHYARTWLILAPPSPATETTAAVQVDSPVAQLLPATNNEA